MPQIENEHHQSELKYKQQAIQCANRARAVYWHVDWRHDPQAFGRLAQPTQITAKLAPDLLKEIWIADRRQAHGDGVHEEHAIMFGQPLKDVVFRMGMVVPPVLARETHDRLSGQRVVGRLPVWCENLSVRDGPWYETSGVHAWQTPLATAS